MNTSINGWNLANDTPNLLEGVVLHKLSDDTIPTKD